MKLQEKVVVITGGGNGMGRELVLQALKRGARVAALDIRQESLDEVASIADAGDRLSTHLVNIAERERVAELPDEVIAHHGAVDCIINNAGIIQPFVDVSEVGFDVVDRVINVNLHGTINMTKTFLPHLLKRPEGHVLNVSSMGGFIPFPGQSIYGAAKAGVKLLTEGLYAELLETNVGVSIAMPGAIGTDIVKNSGAGDISADADGGGHKTLAPADAAKIMLDGIERNRFYIYVGSDAKFMSFLRRIAPQWAVRFIQKQMKNIAR